MVRIRILASVFAICTGDVFASGTCQSESIAEEVTLLQSRHAVRKHAQPQEDIEEELHNEEVVADPPAELPPVPVWFIEGVGDWTAENPSAAAVFRQAIREQLMEVTQIRGPDDFRIFSAAFPRAANAVRQWQLSNTEQSRIIADIVAEIGTADDMVAAALHDWAETNTGFAAALRGETRERLLQVIF